MKTKHTNRFIAVAFILIFFLTCPVISFAKSIDTIIAFGDSLTDHYGLQSYLGPYDPVENPGGALESWTNGDVWVDYLADRMGVALENNAIAGAMTLGHENNDIQALSDAGQLPQLGLIGQIDLFAQDASFLGDSTLFTILIGGNDLLKFGRGESDAASPEELITNAVNNIFSAMNTLAAEGAKHILVVNLPDLGKTPAYNGRTPTQIAQVTELSGAFNSALDTVVHSFEILFPEVQVYTFDLFALVNKLVNDGVFNNSTGTYMVLDENGDRTGETNEPASDYLFWDSIHPTTGAHELVAINVSKISFNTDDDDSTCFISTVNAESAGNHFMFISCILLAIGFTGLVMKKTTDER